MTTERTGAVRRLLRKLPEGWRWRWHRHRNQVNEVARAEGWATYARWIAQRTAMWLAAQLAARTYYVRLSPAQARAHRRSDTVFIFGSGYSLNDLGPDEWRHFAEHDVFGFAGFVYQQWVRVDFNLLRSWDPTLAAIHRWPTSTRHFADLHCSNPRFRDAVLIVQNEHSGIFGNTLVGLRMLPRGSRLLGYWTARRLRDDPTERWRDGITHGQGALVNAVNVAYLLGWKNIVLVGVDLYDNRYFWGPPDASIQFGDDGRLNATMPTQDHGARWDEPHLTARRGVVELLGRWRDRFARDGVRLSVYNPRSLLTHTLPVYERPAMVVR